LYYRTKREDVHYVISAGAGADIYRLKREGDAIPGDVYYGREVSSTGERIKKFRYHSSDGEITFDEAVYFLVSVTVTNKKIIMKMIDTTGKAWDEYKFNSPEDIADLFTGKVQLK